MRSPTVDPAPRRDGGFTLIELLISMMISGVLVAALATAVVAAIRTTPDNEDRIDDARSTRTLSTYLAQDVTSTPPFIPEQDQGGVDVSTTPSADNNDCGADGTNIVHLQWTETITDRRTYVANYRFVTEDGAGRVRRITCFSLDGGPFALDSSTLVTPNLDPAAAPAASVTLDGDGNVELLSFTLIGRSGESVLVEVASRNPSEFFPS